MSSTHWRSLSSTGGEYRRSDSSLNVRTKPVVETSLKVFLIIWEVFWVLGCAVVSTEYFYGRDAAEIAWHINISDKSANPGIWLAFAVPAAIYVASVIAWLNFGEEQCSLTPNKLTRKVGILGFGLPQTHALAKVSETYLEKTTTRIRWQGSPIETRYNVCLTVDGKRVKLFSRHKLALAKQLQTSIIEYASQHGVKIKIYERVEANKT
jgi:hypothetical protein